MRTKCAQFPGFSFFLRRKRELCEAAAREQKGSAEGERGLGFARGIASISVFSATPGFEAPLPVSQHHHEPAPSHFRHYDTQATPVKSAAATATGACRPWKPPEKPLWPAADLGCSSLPYSCPGAGQGWSRPSLGPSESSTAPAGGAAGGVPRCALGLTKRAQRGLQASSAVLNVPQLRRG